ncbi:FHA domain-containing protein [Dyella sp. 2HG41-7]|uniref:FHA domain-containing protein n=1 Tax=Dyella sp. 2HG41-7 TaxID=2883239 RepID=UPI001F1A5D42|nr:FHA domain-containing protein [Dyella sp. 2HG41-7]
MSMNTGQPQPEGRGKRRAGPQGTQLLSVAQIQQLALDDTPVSNGRASTHEPVLEGVRGEFKGRRYLLRQGRRTIGRRDDNDIVIDDPSVSATHAWIINQHGHYVLMNTLSTNGTFVNDKRIHETVLAHGDRVRFGQTEFAFLTREYRSQYIRRYLYGIVTLLGVAAIAGLIWWWF